MSNPPQTSMDRSLVKDDEGLTAQHIQDWSVRIQEVLSRVAQGDLSFRIEDAAAELDDEGRRVLTNLDEMARRLRYIVGRLQRAADSIDAVVGEVLRGTQALSSGVIDEARSVEDTSTSISEINA